MNEFFGTAPTLTRREMLGTTASVALVAAVPGGKALAQALLLSNGDVTATPAIYKAIPAMLGLRCTVLLQQIHLNYNYYGRPRNWVPPVSLNSFAAAMQPIIDNLSSVDVMLASLLTAHDKSVEVARSINDSIQANATIQNGLTQNIRDANSRIVSLLGVIEQLGEEISCQYQAVVSEQGKFDAAVLANASPRCGFSQTLAIAEAVVAVVGAVYTGGASLALLASSAASAASSIASTVQSGIATAQQLEDSYNNVKTIVKDVKEAEADLSKINASYLKLKSEVDLGANPDAGKIYVDKDGYRGLNVLTLNHFDSQIDSASVSGDLKSEFKAVVHKYVELVDIRNQKITDHDSLVLAIQTSAAGIATASRRGAQLFDTLNNLNIIGNTPDADLYRLHLQEIQNQQKQMVLEMLADENAALTLVEMNPSAYHNLSLSTLLSSTPSTANLISMHTAAQLNTLNLKILRGPGQSNTNVHIQRTLNNYEKDFLKANRAFSFFTAQDDFDPLMSEVYVTGFSISTDVGIPGLSAKFSHLGQHVFRVRSGEHVEFLSGVYAFGVNGEGGPLVDTTDGGQYFGFSGLGGWRIEISPAITDAELAGISAFKFIFSIAYVPANTPLV